mmetsp:Transcript_40686/g.128274  ORF Transcript_40686/g.128274 Transcript_40686/m.128274 type:complete len:805 (-) Transcript_40686:91-2505(-)
MHKSLTSINLFLDYFPSAQFAGIHVAKKLGLFEQRGLLCNVLKPSGAGGEEPELVCRMQAMYNSKGREAGKEAEIAVGTVEQNVLIPAIARGVKAMAFGTVFHSSPLAIASLKKLNLKDMEGRRIGMHVDSMELMHTLVSHADSQLSRKVEILEVSREKKVEALVAGEVDAIQIYDCMELLELQRILKGEAPHVLRLEDMVKDSNGRSFLPLGYSQVLFCSRKTLQLDPARQALREFLGASREGWRMAQQKPEQATEAVLEAREELGCLTGTEVDSFQFQLDTLKRVLGYVVEQGREEKVGLIDPHRWQEASNAMAARGYASSFVPVQLSLDQKVWPEEKEQQSVDVSLLQDGLRVSSMMREEAGARAAAIAARTGRKPCLAIVNVGEKDPNGQTRLKLFAEKERSWFDKAALCESVGIDTRRVELPASSSFGRVHDALMSLNRDDGVDAILLERPLPPQLDAELLGSVIVASKDVDAEGFLPGSNKHGVVLGSQGIYQPPLDLGLDLSLSGKDEVVGHPPRVPWTLPTALVLPCTVEGVMQLLLRSGAMPSVTRGLSVVVGRSRKLGAPLALALMQADATVAVCHSRTSEEELRSLCLQADTLFVCAGSPHLISKDMVKKGAIVINVGTTFSSSLSSLLPDVQEDVADVARVLTPTPHGVGPTCAAALTLNVVTLAEARARTRDLEKRHKQEPTESSKYAPVSMADVKKSVPLWSSGTCSSTNREVLQRTFKFKTFLDATAFLDDVAVLSERANHHPSLLLNSASKCEQEDGCHVRVELGTFANLKVTAADINLARRIDMLRA